MHMSIDAQAYVRNAVQIANVQGNYTMNVIQPTIPETIAREIDPPVEHYQNFQAQLAEMVGELQPGSDEPGPRRVMIVGELGSGKSELPRKFADEHGQAYPRGHFCTRMIAEIDVHQVLVRWLGSFGYSPDQLPPSLEALIMLWRTVTTGEAVLVVIDDALSADDVLALMPGRGPSAVIVVPIGALDELENRYSIRRVHVTPLGETQSLALLGHRIGADRLDAEPAAAARLVALCGESAAPLNVAARILFKDPYLAIAEFVAQLERRGVLRRLSLSPIFDAAYDRLDDHSRVVYHALGAHPGGRLVIAKQAIAAAVPLDQDDLDDAFDALVDANLIGRESANGYRMPVLVAMHAAAQAADQLATFGAAITAYYCQYGLRCAETLTPNRGWSDSKIEPLAAATIALTWLDANEPAIVAAALAADEAGDHSTVVTLCLVTWPLYLRGAHPQRMVELTTLGVRAAKARNDEQASSLLHTQLGFGYRQQRRWTAAQAEFEAAMAIGPLPARASAMEALGLMLREKHELGAGTETDAVKARTLLTENLALAEQIFDECERALARNPDDDAKRAATRRLVMARFHLATVQEPAVAVAELLRVRGPFEGEQANRIKIDLWLGRKLVDLGNLREAADVLNRAARDVETAKMRREEGLIWRALADAEPASAGTHLARALRILEFGYQADAAGVRARKTELGLPD
jgi:tetratricopeptide (TPR) repeat protein